MRSSWADTVVGDGYLPVSNRQAVAINYHKKLGSGATYGESMHAEIFCSPTLKQVTG